MTHVGQRLSALIDGELDGEGRDRVLVHLAKCESCRSEAVALRTLKRRMNALGSDGALGGGDEATSALTGRLMGLPGLSGGLDGRGGIPLTPWSAVATSLQSGARAGWLEARPAWFMFGGAFTVFLAGLGTAAFMVGGSPQLPQPAPQVTPAVDVFVMEHELVSGEVPAAQPSTGRRLPTVSHRTLSQQTASQQTASRQTARQGAVTQRTVSQHSSGQHTPGRRGLSRPSGGQRLSLTGP